MYTQTKDYPMYVAGEWTDGDHEARMEATSPATGEVIGTVPEGTREDVRRAIAAANEAWSAWAARSAFEFRSDGKSWPGRLRRIRASPCRPRPTTRSTS
jgi:delta 1-pyrroline-5-carboxylate dehydrogenase